MLYKSGEHRSEPQKLTVFDSYKHFFSGCFFLMVIKIKWFVKRDTFCSVAFRSSPDCTKKDCLPVTYVTDSATPDEFTCRSKSTAQSFLMGKVH